MLLEAAAAKGGTWIKSYAARKAAAILFTLHEASSGYWIPLSRGKTSSAARHPIRIKQFHTMASRPAARYSDKKRQRQYGIAGGNREWFMRLWPFWPGLSTESGKLDAWQSESSFRA